jgi:hypothetical protein
MGHLESVVEKEVANRNASLGLGIEIHAVSRHVKFSLTHLEAISSSFTVSLFHLDTFEKRPKFHGNQKRERIVFLSTAAWGTFTVNISYVVRKISQAVRAFATVRRCRTRADAIIS